MIEVGIAEAQSTLAALLHQVDQGEEVVITREGSPVIRLVLDPTRLQAWTEAQIADAQAASEEIRQIAKTLPKQPFVWEEIKKDLGRKWE